MCVRICVDPAMTSVSTLPTIYIHLCPASDSVADFTGLIMDSLVVDKERRKRKSSSVWVGGRLDERMGAAGC